MAKSSRAGVPVREGTDSIAAGNELPGDFGFAHLVFESGHFSK
jgi:hypothetical protein